MPLDPSQFEVIDDKPAQADPNQFEVIGGANPALNLSKLGTDPYDRLKLQERQIQNPSPLAFSPAYDLSSASRAPAIGLEEATREKDLSGPDVRPPRSDEGLITSLPKAIVADASAGMSGLLRKIGAKYYPDPNGGGYEFPSGTEMTGNVPAAFMGEPLPIDKTIRDISGDRENRIESVLAKTSLGVAETAPFLAMGALPGGIQKVVAAGFVADMARKVPGTFRQLGEEMGKPENERDQDKISSLMSQAAMEMGFTAMGAKGGAKELDNFSRELTDRYAPRGQGLGSDITKSLKPDPYKIQGPPTLGSMLKTPAGATPELRVEDFEPLDTQSGAPLSPQELIARQSRTPTPPEAPAPEIKTFNLDEEGGQNAPQERIEPEGNQPEHTGDASERTPAQSGGGGGTPPSTPPPAEAPQANEPSALPGDARGTPDTTPRLGDQVPKAERDSEGFADANPKNVLDYLEQLPVGSQVIKHGNIWEKKSDGTWDHRNDIQESGNSQISQGTTEGGALEGGKIHRVGKGETPPLKDDLDKVAAMTDKEFSDWSNENRLRGGMTGVAHEIGQGVQSLEEVNDLKARQDAEAEKFQEAKKKKDFPAMSAAANKGQFFREAYEAATGTGSAGKSLRESNPNYSAPFPEGKAPEMVGMGGAVPSEFEPGAGEGRDIYGISHEVREARAKAGVVDPVERGQGISAPDSIDRGQALLNGGVDPEAALSNFEKTGRLSADDIAVTRARGEELARNARAAERQFGTESPEYKAAYDKISDWDRRTKKMQTEWHKQGMAQQGATDIDTGSFTGLQREFESQTGKKFTPKQEKTAKDKAQKVTEAADKTEEARQELFNELDRQSGDPKTVTAAERRALDAANKTVRDWATRRAQADAKARVAKTEAETKAAAAEQAKTQKVLDIATKKAREAAVRLAKAENDARVAEAAKKADDTQAKATQRALDAAMEVRKKAAADLAKAENDARVAQAANAKKVAKVEVQRTKRALDAANKAVRDAAANAAKNARKDLGLSLSERAWQKARTYIDSGITNFDDIRNKLATDLGMSVDKVTKALAKTKRAKTLTDDLWKKQQDYRRLDQQAKRWVTEQNMPTIQKVIRAVPNLAFAAKVFGHGTVALGTHAPMVAFQPRFWKAYANDFIKMYKMVGSPAFYERQVQDLLRRPNYITARRAGLVNDPHQYEDYNSPEVTKWMGPVANMGNRGYSVLKILRQDMFDQYWNKLPKTAQIPEVAKAIADGVNHATGVVKMKAPPGSNIALFAPRLAASRAAWLVGDPLRALKTFTDWSNASEADKHFAINQVKEKAWVVGTMLGLLAANEGMLEATGSKQRVNFNDPMKRDWMKFKVGGLDVGYGNAMLSMARLPARLYKIRESDGGKLKNLVYPDEDTYSVLGEYGRSQLSPFASLATTLWFKSDWQNRPLPGSTRKVPKRLAAQGVQPYTWPEFWSEQVLPIPAEEAAREVWKNGLGMSEPQIQQAKKALATIAVMAATGARVEDDTDVAPPQNH